MGHVQSDRTGCMLRIYIAIVLFLCLPALAVSLPESTEPSYYFLDETPVVSLSDWRVDDSIVVTAGLPFRSFGLSARGVFVLTHHFGLPEPLFKSEPVAVCVQGAISSATLAWDGVALGGGGSSFTVIIPDSLLRPGLHRIDITVQHAGAFSAIVAQPPELGYLPAILSRHANTDHVTWLLAGVFIATALFLVALAAGRGSHPSMAIFGLYSGACAANMLILAAALAPGADPHFFYASAIAGDIPWYLMTVLLPVFFLFTFATPNRVRISVAIAGLALLPVVGARMAMLAILPASYMAPALFSNQVAAWIGIALALVVAARGVLLKQAGAVTALIGLSVFFAGILLSGFAGSANGWSLGLCVLNLFLLISLSRQMAARAEQHHVLQTRGLRLEMDLLKKHIQPHFLLNSLNSIVAWIEEDPPTAARLVEAFGRELRLLLDMAREPLVPLSREIELCRTHLTVMSLRHDRHYSLDMVSPDSSLRIPPLIVHTLVENGISHGFSERSSGLFTVACASCRNTFELRISNNGSTDVRPSIGGGTGLLYVKARLEEAFPGKWTLTSGPLDNGWETIITITQGFDA